MRPSATNASFDAAGTVRVTERVERYRRDAEKCLELAQSFNDLGAKRALLAMANAWLMLAARGEKNVETAPPNGPPSPTPPLDEPPPLRLNPAKADDPLQC